MFPCIGVCETSEAILNLADTSELQNAAIESDIDLDIKDMILNLASGNTEAGSNFLKEILIRAKNDLINRVAGIFASFAAILITACICCRICHGKEIRLLCAVICAYNFLSIIESAIGSARTLLDRISSLTSAAFPVVTGFLSLSGAASQTLLTPMAGLVAAITSEIMEKWGIYLCCAACACACTCAISRNLHLGSMFSMLKNGVNWLCGGLMTIFVAILSIQGLLGRSYDSAAMRTAQYAIDRLLPVIGGGVSDSLGTVLSSLGMIKTASGVTGMLILISSCLEPLAEMWAVSVSIKLASAMASPLDNTGITSAAQRFSQVAGMLITVCLSALIMSLVLIGAAAASGRFV